MTIQYHTGLSRADLQGAVYAVIPGDPERVAVLAQAIDEQAKPLKSRREYDSYLADLAGEKILVCSTGIGGPAASIAMEELAELGIKSFLRVGTTGAIQPNIKVGDVIVTKAAVRLDGTSAHYAPIEYPAVASFEFTGSAVKACQALAIGYHVGLTASSASFYAGQERYDSFKGFVTRGFRGSLAEWQQLNVLNYEMESATVFTVASAFGLRAACLCVVLVNRVESEHPEFKAFEVGDRYTSLVRQVLLNDITTQQGYP